MNGTSWIHKRSVINIRYAQIRKMDVSNGEGIGVSLFVQGCHFHCKNCFNKDTWDFNGGKEWTEKIKKEFLTLINKPYITRVSILGGEPLANENVNDVLLLIQEIKHQYPDKKIWLWSGCVFETIINPVITDDLNPERDYILNCRKEVLNYLDILVDGRFEEYKKDLTLKFRGSSNQRIIDIKKSLEQNEVVLWCD